MKNSLFFPLLILSLMTSCYYNEPADLLIHNAKIYTVDGDFSIAEALAIKDGKIIDVGPNNEIKNRYEPKEVIDAKNQIILPGFIDAHCHFLWYGSTFFQVNLNGTKSWSEVVEKTIEFSKTNDDLWITGNGWDQNNWKNKTFPTKNELDSLFPNRAVFLKRIDQHAAIVNQKALDLANITTETKVNGGVFEVKNGKLTGLLMDNAISKVVRVVPEMSKERLRESLLKAQEKCFEKGLTTVSDAMLENNIVHLIDSLQQSGELKMKLYGMLTPSEENKKEFLKNGPYVTDKLSIRSFKYFADGALGSRGAKLIEPYSDDSTNTGLSLEDSTYLISEAKALYEGGFQMNTHCIGDGANRQILNIYGEVLQKTNDKRWRIEHAQVVHPSDFEKFKTYTIIPSVQPTHATSDMDWVESRLGGERVKNAYAYKKLLDQNGIIALGTDFPIEDVDPIKTFYAATFRKKSPENTEVFQQENKVSKIDALKGMTIWAAIASFEDTLKGSIEIGKTADLIFLNQDLLEVEETKIPKTVVTKTLINGKIVFERRL